MAGKVAFKILFANECFSDRTPQMRNFEKCSRFKAVFLFPDRKKDVPQLGGYGLLRLLTDVSAIRTFCPILLVIGLALPVLAETKIEQLPDRSNEVETSIYKARIDSLGNLSELSVKGANLGRQEFLKTPDAGSHTAVLFENVVVNVINQTVVVRSAEARTEWTFGEDVIDVETEGFSFEFQLDPSAKLALVKDAGGEPLAGGKFASGRVIGIVLSNDLSVMFSGDGKPYGFHIHGIRMFPNFYVNGFGKPGDKTRFSLKLGAAADTVQFVGQIHLACVGDSMAPLLVDGNQGQGICHFADGVPLKFETTQNNRNTSEPITLEYRLEVYDHFIWVAPLASGSSEKSPHRLFEQTRKVSIPPGGEGMEIWEIPKQKPGFYYLHISAWKDGAKVGDIGTTPFCVDLANYAPKTTRPEDFEKFWTEREAELKATPFNPQLRRLTPETTAAQIWEVTGDMPGGGKFQGLLEVPAGWNGKHALLTATIPTGYEATLDAVSKGKWESTAKIMTLTVNSPEAATYSRWTSATDNNLLENVMLWMRGVDYLKTRGDVKPGTIRLFGASRGGPLVVVTAARRAKDIAGASAHVHTSCGISWLHAPYAGWGLPGGHNPKDPAKVEKLAAMAAYVDPVNHAQDVICPITYGYGISDFTLSPPEGIEAAYILTNSTWKRISRDAGGHQYSEGMKRINRNLDDLLGTESGDGDQKRILTEH